MPAKRTKKHIGRTRTAKGVPTAKWRKAFLKHLADSACVKHSAELAGVAVRTVYQHRESDEVFAAQWQDAIDSAGDKLIIEARRRAVDGVPRYKFHAKTGQPLRHPKTGEPYIEHDYSDALLTRLLVACRPDMFRDRSSIEYSGPNGGPIKAEVAADLSFLDDDDLVQLERLAAKATTGGTGSPEAAGPSPATDGGD